MTDYARGVDMTAVQQLVRECSPFDPVETERLIATRFEHIPRRLEHALRRWPLDKHPVLDVGCSYGQCLIHFGEGSLGVDNSERATQFVAALGLDVVRADVEVDTGTIPRRGYRYAWVSDILEHLDAPRRFLRRLGPLVATDGRMLVQASVLPRSRFAATVLRRAQEKPFDAEVHYHQWTVDTLRHLIARAGFRTVNIVPLLPVPPGMSSRVIVEAVPDAELRAAVERAELRNGHPDDH